MPKQVEQELKAIEEMEKQLQAPEAQPEPASHETEEPQIAEVVPTQEVAPEVPKENWEQKYRTLQGMYDAEVPRLHAQVKDMAAQMQTLQQTIERQSQAPKDESAQDRVVTDKDRELFGEDLIDLQRRIAEEVSDRYQKTLEAQAQKIAQLEQQLTQTGNQVGEMTFEQRLVRAIPDFDAINTDPRWISWLAEVDPMLRGPRKAIAEQAYRNGDVEGVAHYVNLFRQTIAAPKPDTRKTELERQVAPTRNASAATAQPQGKTYSHADWESQSRMVDQLAARGRIEEAQKLEAELFAAMTQGRVHA